MPSHSRRNRSNSRSRNSNHDGGNAALTGAAVPAVLFVANHLYGKSRRTSSAPRKSRRFSRRNRRFSRRRS